MKKELGKHCSQRNFFRGESSGLVFYKTEDIYFTLLMDCMEAHMVMLLQGVLRYNYRVMI